MLARTDAEHLDFATQVGRLLFRFKRGDYFQLHTEYLSRGKAHTGILLANQQQLSVGEQMRRILYLNALLSPEDMLDRIEFLSAWNPRQFPP